MTWPCSRVARHFYFEQYKKTCSLVFFFFLHQIQVKLCQITVGKSLTFSDSSSVEENDGGGRLGKNLQGLLIKSAGWILGTGDGPYFILCSGSWCFYFFIRCRGRIRIFKHSEVMRLLSKMRLKVRKKYCILSLHLRVLKTLVASCFQSFSSKVYI